MPWQGPLQLHLQCYCRGGYTNEQKNKKPERGRKKEQEDAGESSTERVSEEQQVSCTELRWRSIRFLAPAHPLAQGRTYTYTQTHTYPHTLSPPPPSFCLHIKGMCSEDALELAQVAVNHKHVGEGKTATVGEAVAAEAVGWW